MRDLAAFQIKLRRFQLLRCFLDRFGSLLRYRPGFSGFLFAFFDGPQLRELLSQFVDLLRGLVHVVRGLFRVVFELRKPRVKLAAINRCFVYQIADNISHRAHPLSSAAG